MGALLRRHVAPQRIRQAGIVRPFTRAELELLYESMQKERDILSGGQSRIDEDDGGDEQH